MHQNMKKFPLISTILLVLALALSTAAQGNASGYKSQEVSDGDLIPVLIKHLPDWETVRGQTKLTASIAEVRSEFGEPTVLSGIDLNGGAEAAIATYPTGRLLLIEYPSAQASIAADAAIQAKLAESPNVVYKRIGNYNALVFDATSVDGANALLDQIDYGKTVQWLGEDPYFMQRFERYIAMTGRDMVISTVLFIAGGLASAVLIGIFAGFIYYRFREQERSHRVAFSDAGGLTRLNLDELSD